MCAAKKLLLVKMLFEEVSLRPVLKARIKIKVGVIAKSSLSESKREFLYNIF